MSDLTMDLVQKQFTDALSEIARIESKKANSEIIIFTARSVLRKIINFTPQLTSFVKLAKSIARRRGYKIGKYSKALMMGKGLPQDVAYFKWAKEQQSITKMGWAPSWRRLGIPGLPRVKKPSQDKPGSFVNRLGNGNEPYVSLVNEVSYVEKLDAKKGIIKDALSEQLGFMERFIERKYGKMLRRHNG